MSGSFSPLKPQIRIFYTDMFLDERKQKILKAVVHAYVQTAEPVASDQISALCDLGVKSATIRNEMAAMSDLGYLRQPHTSSGRIPSDRGYRIYVDRLMPHAPLAAYVTTGFADVQSRAHSAVDDLISGTCRLLSALTELTALATGPTSETIRLCHIDIRKVSVDKAMVLTLWSNGQLRHAIVSAPGVGSHTLRSARNITADHLLDRTAEEIPQTPALPNIYADREAASLVASVQELVSQFAREVGTPEVYVDGTSYFAKQPEFREERLAMELILSVLEEHSTVARLMEAAAGANRPQVVIGEENPLEPLRACSLVAASYGAFSVRGTIGVCGPTRMDYSRVVATVGFVSNTLSSALESVLPS